MGQNTMAQRLAGLYDFAESFDPRVAPGFFANKGATFRYIPNGGPAEFLQKQDNGQTTNWAPISGGADLDIQDEGVSVVSPATIIDFQGPGVIVTDGGGGKAVVSISGSSTAGAPNTFAGFDGVGSLYTLPAWGRNPVTNGAAFQSTYIPAPGPSTTKIQQFETEINPAVLTTDDNVLGFFIDTHIDRSGSGADFTGGLSNFQTSLTHEFNGVLGNLSAMTSNMFLGDGIGGTANLVNGFNTFALVRNGYTVTQLRTNQNDINIEPTATVGFYAGFGYNVNGNFTGNFSGGAIGHNGNANDWSGLSINKNGTAQNSNGLNVSMGGSANALNVITGFASGTASSVTMLNLDNSASALGASIVMANLVNHGVSDNFNGVAVDNTAVITNQITHFSGNNTANCTNWQGINLVHSGNCTGNTQGVGINFIGIANNHVGLNVNMSGAVSTSGALNTGINVQGGTFQLQVQGTPPSNLGFAAINNMNSSVTIPAGTPLVGTTVLGINFSGLIDAQDDFGAGPIPLSFGSAGFTGAVAVAATKTMDAYSCCILGVQVFPASGGGTITDLAIVNALGMIPAGGALTITNLYGLRYTNAFGFTPTNEWGVSIENANAENHFEKSIVIGAVTKKVSNADVAIEVASTKAVLFANMTTAQKNALTALPGMQVFDTDLSQMSYYNGAVWVNF